MDGQMGLYSKSVEFLSFVEFLSSSYWIVILIGLIYIRDRDGALWNAATAYSIYLVDALNDS